MSLLGSGYSQCRIEVFILLQELQRFKDNLGIHIYEIFSSPR